MDENNTENNEVSETPETKSGGMNWIYAIVALVVVLAGGYYYMTKSANVKTMDGTTPSGETVEENTKPEGSMEKESAEDAAGTQEDSLMMDEGNAPETTSETSDETDSTVKSITVEGGMFYFKPNKITVKKGVPVSITLKSAEGMHDFVIDDLDVKSDRAKAGESITVKFTPEKVGEYEFYCSVSNHKQMGMVGTLVVE